MNENSIIRALNWAYKDSSIKYQVVRRNTELHICLHHPIELSLKRQRLEARVGVAIAHLKLFDTTGVWLYTRPQTASKPEWKTFIDLSTSFDPPTSLSIPPTSNTADRPIQQSSPGISRPASASSLPSPSTSVPSPASASPPPALEPAAPPILAERPEPVSPAPAASTFDLSQHCFIRNKVLVTSSIKPPPENIATLVRQFHEMSDADKETAIAPLSRVLKTGKMAGDNLAPKMQGWLKAIADLPEMKARTAAIWFSRYCHNPSETLAEAIATL